MQSVEAEDHHSVDQCLQIPAMPFDMREAVNLPPKYDEEEVEEYPLQLLKEYVQEHFSLRSKMSFDSLCYARDADHLLGLILCHATLCVL